MKELGQSGKEVGGGGESALEEVGKGNVWSDKACEGPSASCPLRKWWALTEGRGEGKAFQRRKVATTWVGMRGTCSMEKERAVGHV